MHRLVPILARPEVQLHVDIARRFTAAAKAHYDLMVLHTHPAAGRSTLAESFATTVEAFTGYLQVLAPDGILALPHPLRLPPRDSLKLVLTALDLALESAWPCRSMIQVWS